MIPMKEKVEKNIPVDTGTRKKYNSNYDSVINGKTLALHQYSLPFLLTVYFLTSGNV